MFNDKPYSSVNREERFFCALFAHALLSSSRLRQRFVELARDRLKVALDPMNLHVYLETAALRDYWHDLGDAVRYDELTHARRRAVLDATLQMVDIDPTIIDTTSFFWTAGPGSKLWYPGRWNKTKLKESGLEPLLPICWAFNAKPDMLLHSPEAALVIEAKVESAEGSNDAGYDQLATQELIIQLWKRLIPCFSAIPVHLTTLKLRREAEGLGWSDVLELLEGTDTDEFTASCFLRLLR